MKTKIMIILCMILTSTLFCDDPDEGIAPEDREIEFRDYSASIEDMTFLKGPYLMAGTESTQTIMWETETDCTSKIEYGITDEYGQIAEDNDEAAIHEVTLTGLETETLYHYKVTSCGSTTADLSFMTAIEEDTPFRFTVISDTQEQYDISGQIYDDMLDESTFFILHCGDIVSDGREYDQWQTQFADPVRQIGHYVPIYMAIGNHEHNAHWFYDFVSYPEEEDNFSFTYGNAFFLVLNTNDGGLQLIDTNTLAWLDEELASPECQKATWRFAFHHQPAYTEGWGTSCNYSGDPWIQELINPRLEKAGFHFVFNGHTHGYERGYLNGIYYVICGGGGGHLDVHCQEVEHIEIADYVHHHIVLDIKGKTLEFKAIDLEGNLLDSISLDQR